MTDRGPRTGPGEERLTSIFRSFVAWAKADGPPDTTWIISREEAQRVVEEIEWGYREAERATDLATRLDAVQAAKQRIHRRAQAAESALAKVPSHAAPSEALEELRRVKSQKHELGLEVGFMKIERTRLKRRLKDADELRSEAVCAIDSNVWNLLPDEVRDRLTSGLQAVLRG